MLRAIASGLAAVAALGVGSGCVLGASAWTRAHTPVVDRYVPVNHTERVTVTQSAAARQVAVPGPTVIRYRGRATVTKTVTSTAPGPTVTKTVTAPASTVTVTVTPSPAGS